MKTSDESPMVGVVIALLVDETKRLKQENAELRETVEYLQHKNDETRKDLDYIAWFRACGDCVKNQVMTCPYGSHRDCKKYKAIRTELLRGE